jgi:hypothetical protein
MMKENSNQSIFLPTYELYKYTVCWLYIQIQYKTHYWYINDKSVSVCFRNVYVIRVSIV